MEHVLDIQDFKAVVIRLFCYILGPVLEISVIILRISGKCGEVNGADRCGGWGMVQLGFSVPHLLLALVLAHDIVVLLGDHL